MDQEVLGPYYHRLSHASKQKVLTRARKDSHGSRQTLGAYYKKVKEHAEAAWKAEHPQEPQPPTGDLNVRVPVENPTVRVQVRETDAGNGSAGRRSRSPSLASERHDLAGRHDEIVIPPERPAERPTALVAEVRDPVVETVLDVFQMGMFPLDLNFHHAGLVNGYTIALERKTRDVLREAGEPLYHHECLGNKLHRIRQRFTLAQDDINAIDGYLEIRSALAHEHPNLEAASSSEHEFTNFFLRTYMALESLHRDIQLGRNRRRVTRYDAGIYGPPPVGRPRGPRRSL